VISKAEQVRRDVYDQTVAALHRINPHAVPVAAFGEPYAIPRVSNQVRNASPPGPREPSPEGMMITRVSNMQQAVSKLVDEARRDHVPIPAAPEMVDDLGRRLQMLNDYHFQIERKLTYYSLVRTLAMRRSTKCRASSPMPSAQITWFPSCRRSLKPMRHSE
jgi:hypothetical protein